MRVNFRLEQCPLHKHILSRAVGVISVAIILLVATNVSAQIVDVTVTNITSTSATIVWTTIDTMSACVNYGTSTSLGSATCTADPDATVHTVETTSLTANTVYYFEAVSGALTDNNGGAYYSFRTAGSGSGVPYVTYGDVLAAGGGGPADAIVVVEAIVAGSTPAPLSCRTDATGNWLVNLGNLKDAATGAVVVWTTGDSLMLTAMGGIRGSAVDTVLVSGASPQDVGTMTLLVAPLIGCPTAVDTVLCDVATVCVPVPISDADVISVDPALGVWSGGSLCFTADTAGVYAFEVIASNTIGADTCDVSVTVSFNTPPTIGCPSGTIDTTLCVAGPVCVELLLGNWENVTSSYGLWSNDSLCFDADTAGWYTIMVETSNSCGVTACTLTVDVALVAPPVIDCPVAAIDTVICAPQTVCLPLSVTGHESVQVTGATWSAGELCFSADGTGSYFFEVVALNSCHADTCQVEVNVTMPPAVAITCRAAVDTSICGEGTICVDIPISNADIVDVSYGSWDVGQLCLPVDTTGLYEVTVAASNACSFDTCEIALEVTILSPPTLSCAPVPDMSVCQGEIICLNAPAGNYDYVTVSEGTWSADEVCFVADTTGSYLITVEAHNSCGTVGCQLEFNLTVLQSPVIVCPTEPLAASGDGSICVPIAVSGADIVLANFGVWSNDSLCFTADTAGTYDISVMASNSCGQYLCELSVIVTLGCCVLRGDIDGSGTLNVADLTYLVGFLFTGGPPADCDAHADVDNSGTVNVSDLTYLVAYLFQGGQAPAGCF